MVTKTRTPIAGDFLKRYYNGEYCFVSMKIDNNVVDLTAQDIAGQPVVVDSPSAGSCRFVQDTAEGTTTGFIVEKAKLTLANGSVSTEKYLVLVRGPAVVYQEGIPANDVNGDAFTIATLVTRLTTNFSPPVVVWTKPSGVLSGEHTT